MLTHFGLTRLPFARDVPVEALFRSAGGKEALARLVHAAEQRKVMLLTGEVGAGKSTWLRALGDRLDATSYETIYLADLALSPRSLYQQILAALRVEAPYALAKARQAVQETLLDRFRHQKTTVLLVDEAQHASPAVLDALRNLLNYAFDSYSPFALILAGGPELARRLQLQTFEALAQRIELRCHLQPLRPEESAAYVRHQLETAGARSEIFTEEALRRLHQLSGGLPRRINQAASTCLLAAAAGERKLIDDGFVDQLAPEFQGALNEGRRTPWAGQA